jgi:cephalosporin-C deacetylase-like acetyl esterase
MLKRLLAASFAALCCASASFAGDFLLDWKTDKDPVSYLPGETMAFKLQLLEDGKPLDGKKLKWTRSGDDQKRVSGEAISSASEPLVLTSSLDKPGFVRYEIAVFNPDGVPLKDAKGKDVRFEGGAAVQPQALQGLPEPADFDAFWTAQKAKLAAVPLKAELKEVASQNPKFNAFDVKIDCAGGKPVSGYLTIPKDAKGKSLKAKAVFQGYGISGAGQDFADGYVTLRVNAHGIENGREPEYYKALADGELKGYAFNKTENAKPETSYFNGMMLRVLRTLEYLKSRPEWDGKNLMVAGGSQGGLQALNAAGLDQDVTFCYASKPWCSDLGGPNQERLRGWRPDYSEALDYYDGANQAKRIKCDVYLDTGLGDYVCPPSGVSVVYNNLKGPKTIEYIQGATHGWNPPKALKQKLTNKP